MNIKLGEKVTVNEYKGQLRVFTINGKGVLEYHGVLTTVCLSDATRENSHTITGTLESYGIGDNHAIAIPGCYVGEYFPTLNEHEGCGLIGDFADGERVSIGEYHILSPESADSGSLSFNPIDYFIGVESYDN